MSDPVPRTITHKLSKPSTARAHVSKSRSNKNNKSSCRKGQTTQTTKSVARVLDDPEIDYENHWGMAMEAAAQLQNDLVEARMEKKPLLPPLQPIQFVSWVLLLCCCILMHIRICLW